MDNSHRDLTIGRLDFLSYAQRSTLFALSYCLSASYASATVMSKSNGEIDFLGGQNMFDYFVPANDKASGKNLTQYDETINAAWRDQVRLYAHGEKTKDQAIADFKQKVKTDLGLDAE